MDEEDENWHLVEQCKSCKFWDDGCHYTTALCSFLRTDDKYTFEGCAFSFGDLVDSDVYLATHAVSAKKAVSNIKYIWKKDHGYMKNAKINMVGKLYCPNKEVIILNGD